MGSDTPVWFITAASSGFGHEIAVNALQRGHIVIATARKTESIQDLAAAGATIMAFDVTATLEEIDTIVKQVFEKHPRVDYLINAAGFILEGAVEEVTPQEVLDCFNTNVFGAMNTIRAFLPALRSQPVASNGIRATIAMFGSLGSWGGGASFSVYAMTKACTSSLAESLQQELSPFDINSTTIEPGYFRTGFLNPGAMVQGQMRINVYDDSKTPSGQTRRALKITDGNQPGDVCKACEAIVDILTGTGASFGKNLPVRVVLGRDCEKFIREKCRCTLQLLDDWNEVIRSTDHD